MLHVAVLALTFAVLFQVFTIGALGRRIEKLEEDYDYQVRREDTTALFIRTDR